MENDNVETFEDMLDEYGEEMEFLGAARSDDSPHRRRTRQAILNYVARLESRQITPEMLALYRKLQSGRMVAVDDEAFLYPSEEYNVMQDIVLALGRLIDNQRQAILDYVTRLELNPMYYSDGQRPMMTGLQMLEEIKRLQSVLSSTLQKLEDISAIEWEETVFEVRRDLRQEIE